MEAGSEQITGGGPITGSLIALFSALFTERVFLTTFRLEECIFSSEKVREKC